MEKSPTFFGKTPTFFKKSPTFFLERRRYYPQSEKRDFGRRSVKVVKAKSAKSQGRRARRTRVRKSPYEGGQNGTKATCHFIRHNSCPTLLNRNQHLMTDLDIRLEGNTQFTD